MECDAYIIDDELNYDGVLNSDKMVEAFEWFASFTKNGLSPEPSSLDALGGDEEMFKQGKIGMIFKPLVISLPWNPAAVLIWKYGNGLSAGERRGHDPGGKYSADQSYLLV